MALIYKVLVKYMSKVVNKVLSILLILIMSGAPFIVSANLFSNPSDDHCQEMNMNNQQSSEFKSILEGKRDCCGEACQCPEWSACNVSMHSQVPIIPDYFVFIKNIDISDKNPSNISDYHNRCIPPDIRPPIV